MTNIGTEHPSADTIPHMSPLTQQLTNSTGNSISAEGHRDSVGSPPMLPYTGIHRRSINGIPGGGFRGAMSRSPGKEGSFLARTKSINQDTDEGEENNAGAGMKGGVSPPPKQEGIPIREDAGRGLG
jgi:hypothetical protein